jgi:hypothetical protein
VELAQYDAKRECFPARYGDKAAEALRELEADFSVQARAVRGAVEVTTVRPDESDAEWLAERRAVLQWRLDSQGLQASSSVTKELEQIAAAMQALQRDAPSLSGAMAGDLGLEP